MRPKAPSRRRSAIAKFALIAPFVALQPLSGCTAHEQTEAEAAPRAVAVAPAPSWRELTASNGPVRVKGLRPRLVIHRKRDAAIVRLGRHAVARAGDVVQISYIAAGNRQGVIVSLDDRGVVTLHHPNSLDGASELQPGGENPLPSAYALDDATGFERFIFVTSGDAELDVGEVLAAAEAVAHGASADRSPLRLPSAWQQTSLILAKESAPPT